VGCGSTLGNLLRFASGIERSFRINIERLGNTLFLIRKEKSPTELISGVVGYGHTFPEMHTTWGPDVKGSVSHQRIINYELGGTKILVRSECDGYVKDRVDSSDEKPKLSWRRGANDIKGMGLEMDEDFYASLSIGTRKPSSGTLTVKAVGHPVPQKAVFDLKTRSIRSVDQLNMDEQYRRLWVNQTPQFIFAQHMRGMFNMEDAVPEDISEGIEGWEQNHAEVVRRYSRLLKWVKLAVKEGEKAQIVRIKNGDLEIRKRTDDDRDVLPQDLKKLWS
jgi:hypothetical protein